MAVSNQLSLREKNHILWRWDGVLLRLCPWSYSISLLQKWHGRESHITVRLFADDTVAHLAVKSMSDAAFPQRHLDKLVGCEQRNSIGFDPEICSTISFTRNQISTSCYCTLHKHHLQPVICATYLLEPT